MSPIDCHFPIFRSESLAIVEKVVQDAVRVDEDRAHWDLVEPRDETRVMPFSVDGGFDWRRLGT